MRREREERRTGRRSPAARRSPKTRQKVKRSVVSARQKLARKSSQKPLRSRERVEHRDVVGVNARVGGHQRESGAPGLRDEQTVERIAVMERETGDREPILCGQSEDADTGVEDPHVQVV